MVWEYYTNTIGNHYKFYAVKKNASHSYTGRIAYGRIGNTPRFHEYPPYQISLILSRKIDEGYEYLKDADENDLSRDLLREFASEREVEDIQRRQVREIVERRNSEPTPTTSEPRTRISANLKTDASGYISKFYERPKLDGEDLKMKLVRDLNDIERQRFIIYFRSIPANKRTINNVVISDYGDYETPNTIRWKSSPTFIAFFDKEKVVGVMAINFYYSKVHIIYIKSAVTNKKELLNFMVASVFKKYESSREFELKNTLSRYIKENLIINSNKLRYTDYEDIVDNIVFDENIKTRVLNRW